MCLYKFKDDSTLVGLLSAWISISSGFLFSAIVSLIVQVINDNVYENELKNKRTQIRIRELNILTQELSFFLSFFHDNETYLKSKYKIKDSLLNGKLDINIIHENIMFKEVNIPSPNQGFSKYYLCSRKCYSKKLLQIIIGK